eukprot:symbB.v1.2.003009.t1/scaffold113.1/size324549/7
MPGPLEGNLCTAGTFEAILDVLDRELHKLQRKPHRAFVSTYPMADLTYKNTFLNLDLVKKPLKRHSSEPLLIDSINQRLESASEAAAQKEAIEGKVKGLALKTMFNVGSMAHPDFCGPPCAFIAAGKCINGASCGNCHGSHEKSMKYDKRQRAAWQCLSASEVLQWLERCISSRADKLGLLEEAQPLMQLIQNEIKKLPPTSQSKLSAAQEKNLMKYFSKRPAWKMINEALRHLTVDRASLVEAQALVLEMRLQLTNP